MTRYTVLSLEDEAEHHGTGLSVDEAFAFIMALTETEYVFARDHGVMRLFLTNREIRKGEPFDDDSDFERRQNPDYRSPHPDDSVARQDIMLQAISGGRDGYFAMSDESYAQQEEKNAHLLRDLCPASARTSPGVCKMCAPMMARSSIFPRRSRRSVTYGPSV